jgi:hypothetical protein
MITLIMASPAHAQNPSLTVSYDRTQFLATYPIIATQTFDQIAPKDFPPAQRRVTFNGVSFLSLGNEPPGWAVIARSTVGAQGSGNFLMRHASLSDVRITFACGGSVKAFGFVLHPAGFAIFQLVVTLTNGQVRTVVLPTLSDPVGDFIGLYTPVGMARVKIHQIMTSDGTIANFAVDDVSRSFIRPAC